MILPSSHSPSVKSVPGNDGGGMRTMPGLNSHEVMLITVCVAPYIKKEG